MRPSAQIECLRTELALARSTIDTLRAALIEIDVDPPQDIDPMLLCLQPQGRVLVLALNRAWPRFVDRYSLLDCLPAIDQAKAADRDIALVSVVVHRARKVLGFGAIENNWGGGYRLSADMHASLTDKAVRA